jgi:hypothetical protein
MALQTSTGYVRITNVSLGADNTTLTVSWLTFHNSNWRENSPQRRWTGIIENGSHTFDLAIREKQTNPETGEEEEIITGYKPQSIEQAHFELMNLDVKEAKFKGINWQVVL